MPEFENLEPFLDRDRNEILPVAPHTTVAHDYVIKRRDAHRSRADAATSIAPQPAVVENPDHITTREMEKAFRHAMKESRSRRKQHSRKQGGSLWGRLREWLSSLLSRSTPEASGKNKRAGRWDRDKKGAKASRGNQRDGSRRKSKSGSPKGELPQSSGGGGKGAKSAGDAARPAGEQQRRKRSKPRKRGPRPDGEAAQGRQRSGQRRHPGKAPPQERASDPRQHASSGPGKANGKPEGTPSSRRNRRNRRRGPVDQQHSQQNRDTE